MPQIRLQPNERYSFVGKTGSGKTALAMVLAGTFARSLPDPWEVWWMDTKNDPDDIAALRQWGFRNAASETDLDSPGRVRGAKYFYIESSGDDKYDATSVGQVQRLCGMAYQRRHVIVVIDEFVQAVESSRNAGRNLLDIFQRGRGRKVGLIGLTQEPVWIPRQLLSQAAHLILLNLTHNYDIEYIKKMEPLYKKPSSMGDKYGFFWKWADGDDEVIYYPHQRDWYDNLNVMIPNPTQSDGTVGA